MTEKKPAGMNADRWIDQQVREARERGDFDNLPGTGKPLPNLDQPYDELWWAREFIEREKVSILPETLRLRRDIELFRQRLTAITDEADVRLRVQELNERVLIANSRYVEEPPAPVWPLDEERLVERWRKGRAERLQTAQPPTPPLPPEPRETLPRRQQLRQRTALVGVGVLMTAAVLLVALALG